ncbi:DUF4142 domain-containing protein [Mesorhizobium sp.]|jgi:putative membrane protein|uniref:DUF4142 domain-containing protein n=1 Tax=Mesorhizobium sp. TaxID=1871066 RepID=UPI003561EF37
MKTRLLLASLAAATAMTLALPALAADSAQDFVNKAAVGGMFEVDSSKIAEGKAQDQGVKDFAQKMIDDHGAANAKLETIAGEQKLTVPKELDAKHKGDVDTLQNAKDPIDAPYVQMQRDAHMEAVELFEGYAKDGDNASLKTFAQETLPTLKMHRDMVEKMASMAGDKAATSTAPAAATTDTTAPAATTTDTTAPAATTDTTTAPAATTDTTTAPAATTDTTTPAVTTTGETNPSAPVPGANSFTEDQAKGRIQDAGFADVSALTKDDQGIWRGQATKDGKKVDVALDYQGNVVAGAK